MMAKSLTKSVLFYTTTIFMVIKPICVQMRNKSCKKQKGQRLNADEKQRSTTLSRIRQPIESLFSWIEQQTAIECASKVSSYNGLWVHVFGKLVATLYFWNFVRAF